MKIILQIVGLISLLAASAAGGWYLKGFVQYQPVLKGEDCVGPDGVSAIRQMASVLTSVELEKQSAPAPAKCVPIRVALKDSCRAVDAGMESPSDCDALLEGGKGIH